MSYHITEMRRSNNLPLTRRTPAARAKQNPFLIPATTDDALPVTALLIIFAVSLGPGFFHGTVQVLWLPGPVI